MSDKQPPFTPPEDPDREDQPEFRYVPVEYKKNPHQSDESEINLLDLVEIVWEGRKLVLIITAVFFSIALFHNLFGPEEYQSEAFLVEESRQPVGQFQQLQQQIGRFGAGREVQGISPSLYPMIVQSIEFQRELLREEVEFESLDLNVTLFDFFQNHYDPPFRSRVYSLVKRFTFGLPWTVYYGVTNLFQDDPVVGLPEDFFPSDSPFLRLSGSEMGQIENMRGRISIEREENLTVVSTMLPDAFAAAQVNNLVLEKLQEYATDYQLKKSRQNLEFILQQHEEAKDRYEQAQLELARFRDQNVTLTTAVAQTRLEDLQNQRNLHFGIYNTLAQEVEQARLRLQEETPVFNVMQRSIIPNTQMSGFSSQLMIMAIVLGVAIGVFCVFMLRILSAIRQHIET